MKIIWLTQNYIFSIYTDFEYAFIIKYKQLLANKSSNEIKHRARINLKLSKGYIKHGIHRTSKLTLISADKCNQIHMIKTDKTANKEWGRARVQKELSIAKFLNQNCYRLWENYQNFNNTYPKRQFLNHEVVQQSRHICQCHQWSRLQHIWC